MLELHFSVEAMEVNHDSNRMIMQRIDPLIVRWYILVGFGDFRVSEQVLFMR